MRLRDGYNWSTAAVMACAVGLWLVAPAGAQDKPSEGAVRLETSPFAPPKPGQTPSLNAAETPRELTLGLMHWFPITSRCTFTDPNRHGEDEVRGEPAPFVFLTMVDGGHTGLERGYVMANGLVRELEKGRTAATKDGAVVTVWRSAGEPRINVNLSISVVRDRANETPEYEGSMTVFWGDKKEQVNIAGECRG
ncbi:hypothetical protein VQ042_04035 [Aurantimonas sp. A2-1-M11]|uniref:hypothetical protein n=1 Tax=Aurantimonas sp. A2-1-M11 TaxID=3113712 RepID=UPI002F951CFD